MKFVEYLFILSRVADGEDDFQVWRIPVDILNKRGQPILGGPPAFGVGQGAN